MARPTLWGWLSSDRRNRGRDSRRRVVASSDIRSRHGPGIHRLWLERILDHHGATTKPTGYGFGLTSVQEQTEALNGEAGPGNLILREFAPGDEDDP